MSFSRYTFFVISEYSLFTTDFKALGTLLNFAVHLIGNRFTTSAKQPFFL